jgi:hypothetical protein
MTGPEDLGKEAAKYLDAADVSAGIVAAGAGFVLEQALNTVAALGAWDVATGAGLLAAGVSMGIRRALANRRKRTVQRQFAARTRSFADHLEKENHSTEAESLRRLVDALEYGTIDYPTCSALATEIVRKFVL